jgi:hypothetical protein
MVSYFVGSNIVSWQQLFKTENHADEPQVKKIMKIKLPRKYNLQNKVILLFILSASGTWY